MRTNHLRRLDSLVIALLLLWAGMALGFGALSAPALFRLLPSRDLAATVAGVLVARLDLCALAAFGGALLLGFGGRWILEVPDAEPLSALKLWSATAAMAVVLTAFSTFLLTPRIRELRAAHQGSVSSLPEDHPDRAALQRNHQLSTQVFLLRILLALGLAWSVGRLPGREGEGRAEA